MFQVSNITLTRLQNRLQQYADSQNITVRSPEGAGKKNLKTYPGNNVTKKMKIVTGED